MQWKYHHHSKYVVLTQHLLEEILKEMTVDVSIFMVFKLRIAIHLHVNFSGTCRQLSRKTSGNSSQHQPSLPSPSYAIKNSEFQLCHVNQSPYSPRCRKLSQRCMYSTDSYGLWDWKSTVFTQKTIHVFELTQKLTCFNNCLFLLSLLRKFCSDAEVFLLAVWLFGIF